MGKINLEKMWKQQIYRDKGYFILKGDNFIV